jgi:hypothetical protein
MHSKSYVGNPISIEDLSSFNPKKHAKSWVHINSKTLVYGSVMDI